MRSESIINIIETKTSLDAGIPSSLMAWNWILAYNYSAVRKSITRGQSAWVRGVNSLSNSSETTREEFLRRRIINQKSNINFENYSNISLNNSVVNTDNNYSESKLNPHYVTGFSDGESFFTFGIIKSATRKIGWHFSPIFSIELNIKDAII